jgi:hypothetical protein
LFLIIVNVLGHPKGVGGLTSYFLRGGGMDVFWNDPLTHKEVFPYLDKTCSLNNSTHPSIKIVTGSHFQFSFNLNMTIIPTEAHNNINIITICTQTSVQCT